MLRSLFQSGLFGLIATLAIACGGDAPESDSVSVEAPDRDAGSGFESEISTEKELGPKVVFLGDSITAGLHLAGGATEAFPALLEARAKREGWAFEAVNSGKSGDTSAGGLRKVPWVLKMDPDLVVVELGGNDGLRGQPLSEIEKNLRGIVEDFAKEEVRVLLVGMDLPTSYGEEYTRGYADLYPRIAKSLDLPFVPEFMQGVGGVPEMNYRDGLHPNRAGHEALAEKLAPVLRREVEKLRSRKGTPAR